MEGLNNKDCNYRKKESKNRKRGVGGEVSECKTRMMIKGEGRER